MPQDRVRIIGVAPDGVASLLPETYRLVEEAQMVFGGERLLGLFPSLGGETVVIRSDLEEVAGLIKANLGRKRMVVLASGDPGFYGIAGYLAGKLGKDVIEVVPNVSSMQLAFARIKESWDDAVFVSVHSRPIEDIVEVVRLSRKIGIFTDDKHTPGVIASVLQEHQVGNCQAYVCQDLGSARESVVASDLFSLTGAQFSPLNVLILIRGAQEAGENVPTQQLLGIPDETFLRLDDGLITKMEVRAVSLAKLSLAAKSIVWDIGAGSGGVSIEASLLAGRGTVFAIDTNPDAVAIIRGNIRKFDRPNVKVIEGMAPENLEGLLDPNAVFVGGSGGRMKEILRVSCGRLLPGGRIVVNAVTLENLHAAVEGLQAHGYAIDITLVNVAHSVDIVNLTRLEALNPVFVICGHRTTGSGNGG